MIHFTHIRVVPPYPPIVSIFFTAVIIAMFFVSLGYIFRIYNDRKRIKQFNRKTIKGIGICAIMLPMFYVWYILNARMLIIAIPMILGAFVLAFKEDILKMYIVKSKPISKLNDDDVLALELIDEKMKKALGLGKQRTLWEPQLSQIKKNAKKHKIKTIPVNEYLPRFGPFIFISLVLTLLTGDLLFWILLS